MRPLSARSLAARLRTRTQSRLLGPSAHAVQPSRQQVSSSQLPDCRALHASAPARDASPTGGSSALSKAAVTSPSQELLRVITSHIKAHGPLPLPRYISFCLYHPTLGYYTRSDRSPARIGDKTGNSTGDAVIGAKGDFVTSPEISQVFGELLAIWYISQWQAQGMPKRTRIVELGPGRGTLMEDMLRTFRSIRAFGQTLTDVHLVETSPYMRKLQEDKLAASCRAQTIKLHWHDRIQDVPLAPSSSPGEDGGRSDPAFTMVVAHEFFDALPIHMFEKRATGFREVFVDIDAAAAAAASSSRIYTGNAERDAAEAPAHKLRLVVSQAETLASRLLVNTHDPRYAGFTSEGVRIEVCPEAYEVAQYSAELVSDPGGAGGAGLVVDYGDDKVFNNSFRAFKNHQLADPLAEPGQADLTANVDFAFLREALTTKRALPLSSQLSTASSGPLPPLAAASTPLVAPSAATPGGLSAGTSPSNIFVPPLLSQRSFLLSLGLQQRVQRLVDAAPSDERKQAIIDGAQRLVDKTAKIHGMGKIFKVLGFVPREQGSAPQPSEAGLAHQSPSQSKEVFPFGSELD